MSSALAISLNRAQGAQEAGDANWANAQLQAAKSYKTQLAGYIATESSLRAVVSSALQETMPNLQITADQLASFIQQVATSGFSPSQRALLMQAGVTDSANTLLQNLLAVPELRARPS